MVVTHRIVLKTLLAYFAGIDLNEMLSIDVPMHSVFQLDPKPYGTEIKRYLYNTHTKSFNLVGTGI
jgi:6-phosphofructo-2-kinase